MLNYKKVLHIYSTCNAGVSWMFSAGGNWFSQAGKILLHWTSLYGKRSCRWFNLLNKVILTAHQFAACPTLNETSADDLWLTRFLNHWIFTNINMQMFTSFLCWKSHKMFPVPLPTLQLHTDILVLYILFYFAIFLLDQSWSSYSLLLYIMYTENMYIL